MSVDGVSKGRDARRGGKRNLDAMKSKSIELGRSEEERLEGKDRWDGCRAAAW